MDVHVVEVPWSSHMNALRSVRAKVFIEEQGVPRELEWDGMDESSTHFIALSAAGIAVGTARLLPDGQIGRMAVLPDMRRQGIGRRLLDLAVETAQARSMDRVYLHAQTHALGFYRDAGFLEEGAEFMEAGIPHMAMTRALALPYEPPETPEKRPSEASTDVDDRVQSVAAPDRRAWIFRDTAGCSEALSAVLGTAVRRVQIHSHVLDHELFDDGDLVAVVSEFARKHVGASLRIIIHSTRRIVSESHLLIELARRLPSRIEVRVVQTDYAREQRSWVCVDDQAYWLLPDYREHSGFASTYDPVEAKRLAEAFAYLWEHSVADPELRTLRL